MERSMDEHDHRIIGNRLDLFHQQEEGPGMVFWHPNGVATYRAIEDYIRSLMRKAGFREVRTPQLLARSLWEASGHWEKFGDAMFVFADGERVFALKPMSCPGHIQIFNKRIRSFRDLPLRFCEFGACHRYEASGALQGLMRTRAFTQDDAHIFCTEAQIEAEVARFCTLLRGAYEDFGFPEFTVGFSTRPAIRAGSDALWDRAESALEAAGRAAGLMLRPQPGEGTFYGPKLDFTLRDRAGRDWQCGTIQLDFVLPERLGANYIDASGARVRPVLIHHAVLGSIERFLGMLLEHYCGSLPLWLAPEQVMVASVSEHQGDYAASVAAAFEQRELRVRIDAGPERLARKVGMAHEAGIPILAAIGAMEARGGTVSLRRRDGNRTTLSVDAAVSMLRDEVDSKR
jgi:threonyl-tRNA synthetase